MEAIIIEDDKLLAARLSSFLSQKYETCIYYDSAEGLEKIKNGNYDLIVVDSILPKKNINKFLKELKECGIQIPTVILTFTTTIEERIEIADYSFAEYFVKHNTKENFLNIIDNLVKRYTNQKNTNIISYKDLSIEINNKKVHFIDKEISTIKGKYFDLLYFFVLNNNIVLKKEEIFERVWGVDSETTMNAIEVYISGLRKELKKVGCENYLKTIRGVGYSFS